MTEETIQEKRKRVFFAVLQVIGIFGVAFLSTYQYAFTNGGEQAINNCKEFIYNNCTCWGYTDTDPNAKTYSSNLNISVPFVLPS